MYENKFASQKQYLFGLLYFENPKETSKDQGTQVFYSVSKGTFHKPLKVTTLRNIFSNVCRLVQLVSVIFFYFMWFQLEDTVFWKSLFLPVDSFQPPCSWLLWNKHICELPCTERVSPVFQATDSLKKCCSTSPAFVLSHPLWNHCLGNVNFSLLSKLVYKLLFFE